MLILFWRGIFPVIIIIMEIILIKWFELRLAFLTVYKRVEIFRLPKVPSVLVSRNEFSTTFSMASRSKYLQENWYKKPLKVVELICFQNKIERFLLSSRIFYFVRSTSARTKLYYVLNLSNKSECSSKIPLSNVEISTNLSICHWCDIFYDNFCDKTTTIFSSDYWNEIICVYTPACVCVWVMFVGVADKWGLQTDVHTGRMKIVMFQVNFRHLKVL